MTLRRRLLGAGAALAATAVVVFGVLAPPEHCPGVDRAELRTAASETVDWFVRNQNHDGTWLYLYEPDTDRVVPDYNEIRHSGAIMGLYQAATAGIPGAQEAADRGLEWSIDHLFRHDDWATIRYHGQTAVGGAALLISGLAERRELTDDDRYDDLMEELGRFLVAQTEESGAVLAYYDAGAGKPVAGQYSKYYTGEAYWALARMARLFPDGPWGEVADRVGGYLASDRDDEEGYFPPIPDHWAAYGMAETARERPLTEAEVDYAREQAGLFGAQIRWVAQRHGPWGLLVRGPMSPRGGGYGVVGEALGGWWRAARADDALADLEAPLAERARCTAALAIEAQSDADEAADFPEPDRVRGAWFHRGETRMDDQQHALSALLAAVPIVTEDQQSDRASPAPPFWLWFMVLVAAFNPFRVALSLPGREERTPRQLAELALVGGAVGALAVALFAMTSGPLLDLLNVSRPALRIAVGVVAVLAAVVAFLRRPATHEPQLEGARAALVPVAFPLVAGAPGLLFLALGADADRGLATVLAGLVVGLAGLVALAARVVPGDTPRTRRVLTWLGRLLGAVLLVGGVLLVIDGIYAV